MKKAALLTIVLLGLLTPFSAIAASKVNIDISNNGDGSKNSVNVKSNTSSNSTSDTKSTTDVRIESNGEVKEYHSENGEDVDISSSDGKSTVKIDNNQSITTPKPSSSSSTSSVKVNVRSNGEKIEIPETPTPPPTPNTDVLGEKIVNHDFSLGEFIKQILSSIRIKF